MEERVQWGEKGGGLERQIIKKEETFRGDKYVHYLESDDCFRSTYMC